MHSRIENAHSDNRNHLSGHSWLFPALIALILLGGFTACRRSLKPDRYNVLMVTLDTTRADRIGCYGYPQALTPVLDQLAREGVRFQSCRTPTPLTLPAHTTLLTGLYPPEHGLRINGQDVLAPDLVTLPQVFSNAGYRCGAFIAATVLDRRHGLNRGCEIYEDRIDIPKISSEDYERTGHLPELTPPMRSGAKVVDAALAWLDSVRDRPFYAWVHLYDPHYPYDRHDNLPQVRRDDPYDEEIAYADFQVGRLVKWLDQYGLKRKTLILIVGDHGESLGEHGEATHGLTLYESALRVPFILSGPPRLRSADPIVIPVGLVDIFPTLLDCVGQTRNPMVTAQLNRSKGRSLFPLLCGDSIPARSLYAETIHAYHQFGWAPQQGLIDRDWKLIRSPTMELFDLSRDPHENTNRWNTAEQSRAALNQLLDFEKTLERTAPLAQPLASEDIRKLEALGYVAGGQKSIEAAYTNDAAWTALFNLRDIKDGLHISRKSFSIRAKILVNEVGDEVLEEARTLVKESPETVFFHNLLGCIYLRRKEFDPAIATFQQALEINPDYSESINNLAMAYMVQQRFSEAELLLRREIENSPQSVRAHKSMGYVLLNMGQPAKARDHFELVLQREPGSHGAHKYLGDALLILGDEAGALAHYNESFKLNPGWVDAALPLARLLMSANEPTLRDAPRALQVAWQASETTEHQSIEPLTTLAAAYASLGRPQKAADITQEALAVAQKTTNELAVSTLQIDLDRYLRSAAGREE
jgi:arylsulfatase A-like enzyme/Flp pilus assembly protein TadD